MMACLLHGPAGASEEMGCRCLDLWLAAAVALFTVVAPAQLVPCRRGDGGAPLLTFGRAAGCHWAIVLPSEPNCFEVCEYRWVAQLGACGECASELESGAVCVLEWGHGVW